MITRAGESAVASAADTESVERLDVECLRCGHQRAIVPGPRRYQGAGECPRCRYVGWADSAELNEHTRGLYRSVPPDHRVQRRVLERL